ncbi:MAG: [protein-PII] uridylyltransferase [Chloroflexi bacterium]|nr:[protein-PII] uridylyltransferase [Chloroflexota bacterium]
MFKTLPDDVSEAAIESLLHAREELRQSHAIADGGPGHARALARAVDSALVALCPTWLPGADWALLAVGGYGRGELSPFSDVDLLILSRRPNKIAEQLARTISYALWDAKLEVAPAVRDLADALRLPEDDFARVTSYLQARPLAGDESLGREFSLRLRSRLARDHGRAFLRNVRLADRQRHEASGEADQDLEPDLKEGKGGLRDVQSLLLAGAVILEAPTAAGLVASGYLAADEVAEMAQALELLWAVRHRLHYASGRRSDRAYFALQEEVASFFGHGHQSGRAPAEHLMRTVHAQAAAVTRATTAFWEHVEEELLLPRSAPGGWPVWLGSVGRPPARNRGSWRVRGDRLDQADPDQPLGNPEVALAAFAEAARRGVLLGHVAIRAIRAGLARGPGSPLWTERAWERFLAVLAAGERSAELLGQLADCGLLGLYLPEWEAVRYLAHHDLYHLHTVDRHSALTVRELNRLAMGQGELGELGASVAGEVSDFELLLLAGLVHDLGKGGEGNHCTLGAELAVTVAKRLGLAAERRQRLALLVRHHLDLARAATRRDLDDPSLVRQMATVVGDPDTLRMLFLLTVADSVATGPSAWNDWKATLLRDLFFRTLRVLESGETVEAGSAVAKRQQLRLALAESAPLDQADAFLLSLPEPYILSQPPAVAQRHLALRQRLGPASLAVDVSPVSSGPGYELTLATADRPGLLWRVCGVFALHGLNILEARVYTDATGTALDVFRLAGAFEEEIPGHRWPAVLRDLEQVLDGRLALGYRLARKLRPYRQSHTGPERQPKVTVDNSGSAEFTIVEVHARDRLGLLYAIARALDELGLSIHVAKVATRGPEAVDSFYLRDQRGLKVMDQQLLPEIEHGILFELQGLDR